MHFLWSGLPSVRMKIKPRNVKSQGTDELRHTTSHRLNVCHPRNQTWEVGKAPITLLLITSGCRTEARFAFGSAVYTLVTKWLHILALAKVTLHDYRFESDSPVNPATNWVFFASLVVGKCGKSLHMGPLKRSSSLSISQVAKPVSHLCLISQAYMGLTCPSSIHFSSSSKQSQSSRSHIYSFDFGRPFFTEQTQQIKFSEPSIAALQH